MTPQEAHVMLGMEAELRVAAWGNTMLCRLSKKRLPAIASPRALGTTVGDVLWLAARKERHIDALTDYEPASIVPPTGTASERASARGPAAAAERVIGMLLRRSAHGNACRRRQIAGGT